MPLYLPVTPETMNWRCVVFGGVVVIATIYWFAIFSKNKVVESHNEGYVGDQEARDDLHRGDSERRSELLSRISHREAVDGGHE